MKEERNDEEGKLWVIEKEIEKKAKMQIKYNWRKERRGGGGRKGEIKGEIEIECDEEGEKKNGREWGRERET